jgi:hypothetical protein
LLEGICNDFEDDRTAFEQDLSSELLSAANLPQLRTNKQDPKDDGLNLAGRE